MSNINDVNKPYIFSKEKIEKMADAYGLPYELTEIICTQKGTYYPNLLMKMFGAKDKEDYLPKYAYMERLEGAKTIYEYIKQKYDSYVKKIDEI